MAIAVDFDGTCVSHEFPLVGNDIGSVRVLKNLVEAGHNLILWTMRSDKKNVSKEGPIPENGDLSLNYLTQAIEWFKNNDIKLYGIQRNPTQDRWTTSPKCFAEIYIDDAALGCPLKYDKDISSRPFVDWVEVEKILIDRKIL